VASRADLHAVRHHRDAEGLPIVLVHGSPDRSKSFARAVALLPDYPVTVYDRRGYGKSLAAGAGGSVNHVVNRGGFSTHADDLIDLLDGTPHVVVGQSAGGAIAMLAATRAPELFLALGVWEPPMVPWDWWVGEIAQRQTARWAAATDSRQMGEDMVRIYIGTRRWDTLPDATKELTRAEGAAFVADMRSQREPYLDFADLTVPMVVGAGDASLTAAYAGAHQRTAEHSRAEYLSIEGVNHFAHTGNPGAWVALVHRTVAIATERATRATG
jgi:pimeloyl-ACP methyl ester carboxylesterase